MEVILLTELDRLGDKHSVVRVKPGYGRNYLIPKGLAMVANETNLGKLEKLKEKEAAEFAKALDHFKDIAEKVSGAMLKIGAKTGTSGKIFGSVTNVQIAEALKSELDIDIERRKISIPEEVKVLGNYVAELDLHPEVQAKVNFEVVSE
jgi:large subunit ribosomal protein L9